MNLSLPETYLTGLSILLLFIAILVGRQLLKTRADESKLIQLEKGNVDSSNDAGELYELASVQIKKRLYPQATATLKKAIKKLKEEPNEARAVIENALGFSLAAQNDFKSAITHYKTAIKAKSDYPVALNNLAFAKKKLLETEEACEIYEEVLKIDPKNKTAKKGYERLQKRTGSKIKNNNSLEKGF